MGQWRQVGDRRPYIRKEQPPTARTSTENGQEDPSVVAQDALISRWPFNDGLTDTVDGREISVATGQPEIREAAGRTALVLDGEDGLRISRGGHGELSLANRDDEASSISIWAYFDAPSGGQLSDGGGTANHSILKNDTGIRIVGTPAESSDGVSINFSISPYGDASAERYLMPDDERPVVSTQEWHHLVFVVRPAESARIYVDGQEAFVDESVNGYNNQSTDFWTDITLGSWYGGNPEYWGDLMDGKLSDLRFYDTGLSGNEISRIYQSGDGDEQAGGTEPSQPSTTQTPTDTPERTETPRQTSTVPAPRTTTEVPYDLEKAQSRTEVEPIDRTLYVLEDIPDASDRTAVTTPDYELIDSNTARDALVTYVVGQSRTGFNWEDELEYARTMRGRYGATEIWTRAATIGWDALAAYAMAQVNRAAAIGPTIELLQDSTAWAVQEITDPYMEAMSKQTQWTYTHNQIRGDIRDADSLVEMSDSMYDYAQLAVKIAKATIDELPDLISTARSIYSASSSFTTALTGAATSSVVYYAALGELVGRAVDTVTAGMEENAKLAAIGHAYSTTRIPMIERIIELETQRQNNTLSPCGAWELGYMKMNHHYMGAFANKGMYKYAHAVEQSLLGGVWDFLVNVDEVASVLADRASDYQWGGAAAHREFGNQLQEANSLAEDSINSELNGAPAPIGGGL